MGKGKTAVTQRRNIVLCISDDPVRLNLRCSLLKQHGWEVLTASSGYEGVILFSRSKADVVVVELNDGGAEAALITGELKRIRPEIPVVVLLGGSDPIPGATDAADVVISSHNEQILVERLDALRAP